MSTDSDTIVSPRSEVDVAEPSHYYVATKKGGVRQEHRVVDEERQQVVAWLEAELDQDPSVRDWTRQQYNKTVYEDTDGNVLGHVIKVPTLATYREETPDAALPDE